MTLDPSSFDTRRFRERATFLLCSGVLVIFAHLFDILASGQTNWPALGVRIVWASTMFVTGIIALRTTSRAVIHTTSVAQLLTPLCYVLLILVTGGMDSAVWPFTAALMILLPMALPEQTWVGTTASILLAIGVLAILVHERASYLDLLAWGHCIAVSIVAGTLLSRVQGRIRQALDEEARAHQVARVENEKLVVELRDALAKVKTLKGLVPVCAWCRRIRNDRGYWEQMEAFLKASTDAEFSHGICPECSRQYDEASEEASVPAPETVLPRG